MLSVTLEELYADAAEPIAAALEETVPTQGDELFSPELLDHLVWSVLVNFVVCLGANLVMKARSFREPGRPSRAEVREVRQGCAGREIELRNLDEQEVLAVVMAALDSAVPNEVREPTAIVIARALKDAVERKR